MSQLLTLIWLKWTLFRNSLRSKKAIAGRVAATVGTLAALAFSLIASLGLGLAAYGIASVKVRHGVPTATIAVDGFSFLFLILAGVYLMWATVPLSLGGASQFDAGQLLLYPISLLKVFLLDFVSELTSLGSIFAIPVVISVALGSGLARGNVGLSLVGALFALGFGIALAKWLSISLGALMRKKRTRGETILALIGGVIGLSGAFAGQLAPTIIENEALWRTLRWSPPGAAVMAVVGAPHGVTLHDFYMALAALSIYTFVLVAAAFWIARRSALGMGGARRAPAARDEYRANFSGWRIPLLSPSVAAVLEKELRYAMRNAQLRMLGVMPLVLVGVKMMQTNGAAARHKGSSSVMALTNQFGHYTEGMLAAGGVLYVFMIISMLACNSFAYEGSGMRSWILSPIDRRAILVGKNLMVLILAAIFATFFLAVNEIVFGDLTLAALAFVVLAFILFAALISHIGNWLSIHFPKGMRFGKRMNTSGVTGLLLLPMILVMGALVVVAVLAGYETGSLAVKYVTLLVFSVIAVGLYLILLPIQGHALARRERDILEAVSGKDKE